jgi:hypothetical protein
LLKGEGFHFRRQVPIEAAHDSARNEVLKRCGYKVLRFWNHEVLQNADAVMDQIRLSLPLASDLARMTEDHPHPSPHPARGRGNKLYADQSLLPRKGEGI